MNSKTLHILVSLIIVSALSACGIDDQTEETELNAQLTSNEVGEDESSQSLSTSSTDQQLIPQELVSNVPVSVALNNTNPINNSKNANEPHKIA